MIRKKANFAIRYKTVLKTSARSDQNKQGGQMSKYSKEMKKKYELD